MPDLTYTAQGNFNLSGNLEINICIPPEPVKNKYRTDIYNLSKITSFGSINAIFCHFSDGTTDAMQHDRFDYRLRLNRSELKNYRNATDFDESKDDALFIFFHNDLFEESDRKYYFDNLEHYYDEVKTHGNQSQDGLTTQATLTNPRKVGLSLIKKLA